MNPPRALNKIAAHILTLWEEKYRKLGIAHTPAFVTHARPYARAMLSLQSCEETYGLESGDMIVRGFLANVGSWRGEDARLIKAELNQHLESFNVNYTR